MLEFENPWNMPRKDECLWYHSMRFPDGDFVEGGWDIESFPDYIGGYDVDGKSVLDIGAASGFITFSAEAAGATVTALDAKSTLEFRHVPFAAAQSYQDLGQSRSNWENHNLLPLKKSWWYGWHRFASKARCVYAPHSELFFSEERFDIVIAGAIIEHLSDPVFAIGAWTKVAKEAVLIPFTDVVQSADMLMLPMTELNNPDMNYSWWRLSDGLYRQIFKNLGFDFTYVYATASLHGTKVRRPSIIARRINS